MPTLYIIGKERTLPATLGRSILSILMDSDVTIASSCGGVAACGLCRLTVTEGMEHLSPLNKMEIQHLGNLAGRSGKRLACQSRFLSEGEVKIEIPDLEDVAKRKQEKFTQMIRKRRQEQARAKEQAKNQSRGKPQGQNRPKRRR